jgi:hypothetical protein
MSLKSKIAGAAVLAAIVAGVSSASAATSVNLNLFYIGSAVGNASAATRVAQNTGSGLLVNNTNFPGGSVNTAVLGMTQYDMTGDTAPTVPNLKNYFALYADFQTDSPATDRLYGFGFNIAYTPNVAPVSSTNVRDLTTSKFMFWNPSDSNAAVATWDQAGDFGDFAGDLQAIGFYQSDSVAAAAMAVGTSANTVDNGDESGYIAGRGTLLGLYALQFVNSTPGVVTVAVIPGTGALWSGSTPIYSDSIFHGTSIPVGPIPEPASLGVLAVGGLALLARRRKVA